MEVLLLLVMGAVNLLCFVVGAKVGQKVSKDEEIELPKIDHMKAYREKQDREEVKRKQAEFEAIMHNVDNYDGTPYGQKDIPRG